MPRLAVLQFEKSWGGSHILIVSFRYKHCHQCTSPIRIHNSALSLQCPIVLQFQWSLCCARAGRMLYKNGYSLAALSLATHKMQYEYIIVICTKGSPSELLTLIQCICFRKRLLIDAHHCMVLPSGEQRHKESYSNGCEQCCFSVVLSIMESFFKFAKYKNTKYSFINFSSSSQCSLTFG